MQEKKVTVKMTEDYVDENKDKNKDENKDIMIDNSIDGNRTEYTEKHMENSTGVNDRNVEEGTDSAGTNNSHTQPDGKKKTDWNIRPYLAMGLTFVLVFAICIAIFFFILRLGGVVDQVSLMVKSIRGIIFGFVIAYILNPIMQFFERNLNKKMYGGKDSPKTMRQIKNIRTISVVLAMMVFFAVIVVVLSLIIPQLVICIQDLVLSMNDKVDSLLAWIEKLSVQGNGQVRDILETVVQKGSETLENFLQTQILGNTKLIESVTTGVYSFVKFIFNIVIGLIISVYLLMTKERFVGQSKKIIYAAFKPKWGNVIMEVLQKADQVFGGFFIGKIIDSIIIGCICFVCVSIMKMPYPMLLGVIVGVTNVIPFFGPYIGAIPCAILVFLVNPIQALYFLIFILVLQQVDGNIIGPKILGDTTGLSPFWVIFAILLFGGSMGVIGMIFGVPIFAVIYYLIKRVVEHVLRNRKLPDETADYIALDRVDTQTNQIMYQEDQEKVVLLWEKLSKKKRSFFKKKKED